MKGVKRIGVYSNGGMPELEEQYQLAISNPYLREWRRNLNLPSDEDDQDKLIPGELLKDAEETPVEWVINKAIFWLYKGNAYIITKEILNKEQIRLLILEEFDKEREYFERLMRKHNYGEKQETHARIRIPEAVRIEVWRRDGGKCAICSSRVNLEYDHIIPVSKGGSNTARNIELLCEKHNRSKGAQIG